MVPKRSAQMKANDPDKLAYSPKEAMARTPLGRSSFYEAIKRGDIPSVKIGKKILIPIKPFLALFGDS